MDIKNWTFDKCYEKGTGEEQAKYFIESGYPAVHDILPELLKWLQDLNWPGAVKIAEFLRTIGKPLIPHIKVILNQTDYEWSSWIMTQILQNWERELIVELKEELLRIARYIQYDTIGIEAFELLVENQLCDKKMLTVWIAEQWEHHNSIFQRLEKLRKSDYLASERDFFERIINSDFRDEFDINLFNEIISAKKIEY